MEQDGDKKKKILKIKILFFFQQILLQTNCYLNFYNLPAEHDFWRKPDKIY